ncbi:hypothetical protein G6034_19455 [Arthrobacter sp. AETb3-4]|uniref:Uncharacterized protein n=2 Tax=Arthrobacter wenxiniae TaxID=2713570 RepID=A0A7Y7IKC2_9MICC|nr:hypothetical protein [Arthrobacter wenxiniae]
MEEMVDFVVLNPPEDLGLLAEVVEFIVDSDIGSRIYQLIDSVIPVREHQQFLDLNPGFALKLATALAKGGYHRYPQLSDWGQLISKVPLSRLFDEDVTAPLLAVSLAKKHNRHIWGTSRGIAEASVLPDVVLRQMHVDDALFLIRCGARDPQSGIDKVARFSTAWINAHSGFRRIRIRKLADAMPKLSDKPGAAIEAAINILRNASELPGDSLVP